MKNQINPLTQNSPLSTVEEHELAEAIARGDDDALHKLVEANLRLVVTMAKNYTGKGLSIDDLVGEGTVGLTRAAKKYKPSHGTRFSTYACFWIKQEITRAILDSTCLIQLPSHTRDLLRRWKSSRRALTGSLGRPPSSTEIAESLQLSRTQMQNVDAALTATTIKLASTMPTEEPASYQLEIRDPSAEVDECKREQLELLRSRLGLLSEREHAAVALRFGFDDGRAKTHRELAEKLGVSRECVRGVLKRAATKLRYPLPAREACDLQSRDQSGDETLNCS